MAQVAEAPWPPCAGRTGVTGGGVAPRLRLRGVAAGAGGVLARARCGGAGGRTSGRAPSSGGSSSSDSYTGHDLSKAGVQRAVVERGKVCRDRGVDVRRAHAPNARGVVARVGACVDLERRRCTPSTERLNRCVVFVIRTVRGGDAQDLDEEEPDAPASATPTPVAREVPLHTKRLWP